MTYSNERMIFMQSIIAYINFLVLFFKEVNNNADLCGLHNKKHRKGIVC